MKKMVILLMNGVESMEYSPFFDIFSWNLLLGSKDISVEFVANTKKVCASFGMKLELEKTIDDIEWKDCVALVLPGGFGRYGYFEKIDDKNFQRCIQKAIEKNIYILGICTGSIRLAATGLFQSKKMTTYLQENHRYFKQLERYQVEGVTVPICKDGKLWTSSGPATAIPLAFDLLEELTGLENRKYIESIMGF